MTRVSLQTFAKINLTLRVGPARADGFHDIRSVMQSIALGDTLIVSPRKGPFVLATRTPGVPTDRTNLVWRAADAVWRALGRDGDPRDVHVKLDKQIPAAAGLGGGSSDAAAALIALNRVWGASRSLAFRDLLSMAGRLGADVPYFLHGGTVLAAGRGEEIYPLDDVRRLDIVLIKPSFGVATADAYRWLDADRAGAGAGAPRSGGALDVGWQGGPVEIVNDLEPPVSERHPGIQEAIAACRREGAVGAAMSGSGSSVFGVFPESAARKAAARLKRPDWLVILTRTLTRREAARRMGL